MALVKCADCKNEISEIAPQCPFCGRVYRDIRKEEDYRNKVESNNVKISFGESIKLGFGIGIGLILLSLFLAILMIVFGLNLANIIF